MPELPEVETIRLSLEPLLAGIHIQTVQIYLAKALRGLDPEDFIQAVVGERIEAVERRGKYLILRLSGSARILFHLRMTGRLIVTDALTPLAKYNTLIIGLEDGRQLRFEDTRKFGTVDLIRGTESHAMNDLGPEPLDPQWSSAELQRSASNRRSAIKGVLLDQTVVAGLGNIYVDEALHRAGINPEDTPETLGAADWERLYMTIREVLSEAIHFRGTTRRDYVDAKGEAGEFQNRLKVYGRDGLPCYQCGVTLQRKKIAGRSSHFCPVCQPRRQHSQE